MNFRKLSRWFTLLLLFTYSVGNAQLNLLESANYNFENVSLDNFSISTLTGAAATLSISTDKHEGTQSALINVTNAVAINKVSLKADGQVTSGKSEFITKVYAKTDAQGITDGLTFRFQIQATLNDNTIKYYASNEFTLTESYKEFTYTKSGITDNVVSVVYAVQCGAKLGNYYFDNAILEDGSLPTVAQNILVDNNPGFEELVMSNWQFVTSGNAVATGTVNTSNANKGTNSGLINVTTADDFSKAIFKSDSYTVAGDKKTYTVKIHAKTDAQGVTDGLGFKLQIQGVDATDGNKYYASSEYTLTDSFQEFTFTKDIGSVSLKSLKLVIQAGAYTGNYYFDTVVIENGTEETVYTDIVPNDANISYTGSNFMTLNGDGEYEIRRHSAAVYAGTTIANLFNPEKAQSSSGITMSFKTDSPTVKVQFRMDADGNVKNPNYDVYQDDNFTETIGYTYIADGLNTLSIESNNEGSEVEYEITLPIFTDANVVKIMLEDGYSLASFSPTSKPVYLAYGDSITHGQGQDSTKETYPFILADALGYELQNLAVGGGKTSQVMAEMIRDEWLNGTIDMMTVLIGYNDLNGDGASPATYKTRVNNFLDAVRTTHTTMPIFLIKLTHTDQATSTSGTGYTPTDFRTALQEVFNSRTGTDSNLHILNGDDYTDADDLVGGSDLVHLNVSGAANLANGLETAITGTLSVKSTVIKGLELTISNGIVIKNLDSVKLEIYNVLGQRIENTNLTGVIYVKAIDTKTNNTQTFKLI
ncbi:GDSL-type esterase/lipase family protein [Flavobacteriaceae bacterium]|nr:GDSL-type esterase/lipase family protein [Flavobacteriaceae bacterium]